MANETRTSRIELPGQDCYDRLARTGQPGRDFHERTAEIVPHTCQDRDCQRRTASSGLSEQDGRAGQTTKDMRARTGQQIRTARKGEQRRDLSELDCRERNGGLDNQDIPAMY